MRTGFSGQGPLTDLSRGLAAPAVLTRRSLLALGAGFALAGCAGGNGGAPFNVAGSRANHVVVSKSARNMYLMQGQETLAQYRIHLGFAPDGHKERSGDGRTPEGVYWIDRRNPRSEYFLSLGVSYPNAADVARARSMGVNPGGDIFIHGEPVRGAWHRGKDDWTAGCIAVTNAEIEEIWSMVPTGTQITILA
jgi:murein L,D-transpeptidase YafK